MKIFLALAEFPMELMIDDCNLRVVTSVGSQMIKNSQEIIPLLYDSNSHLLRILTAKFGNFSMDNFDGGLETGDNIIVASFSGPFPGVKDFYTKEEVSDCEVDFTRFIFQRGD